MSILDSFLIGGSMDLCSLAHVLPLLEALVVARPIESLSERWTEQLAALYEMTDKPLRHSLQSYYRGTDALYGCREALQRHLADREKEW